MGFYMVAYTFGEHSRAFYFGITHQYNKLFTAIAEQDVTIAFALGHHVNNSL